MRYLILVCLLNVCLITLCSANQSPLPIQQGIVYHSVDDISHYFVSEKLDGVRGYWDGHQLFTRQGNLIVTPKWFTKHWPTIAMDGEIWLGRAKFQPMSALINAASINDPLWRKVTFNLFDLPGQSGDFAQRVLQMTNLVKNTQSNYLKMIPQQRYANTQAVMDKLQHVIIIGGEGLMLHHQDAHYLIGRNPLLMKLKKYQDDEAVILEYIPGKGKFTGMLGAIKVKNTQGVVFKIGSGFTKKQRQHPPAIGTLITYKFFGKTTKGTPRFASFYRVRTDTF